MGVWSTGSQVSNQCAPSGIRVRGVRPPAWVLAPRPNEPLPRRPPGTQLVVLTMRLWGRKSETNGDGAGDASGGAVLVTGASSGIGAAGAPELVRRGFARF